MRTSILNTILSTHIHHVVMPVSVLLGNSVHHHLCPQFVAIEVEDVIDHVYGQSARRTNIDLERNSLIIFCQKKLKMEKPTTNIECSESDQSGHFHSRFYFANAVVIYVSVIVYCIHHAFAIAQRRRKYEITISICQTVVGNDFCINELLNNVVYWQLLAQIV